MTRDLANTFVLSRRGMAERNLFEQYAREGEQFDGAGFWKSFADAAELLHDFELYVRYNDRVLV